MTLDEVMKKYNGVWENGTAIIVGEGGYFWRIATGSPDNFTLTSDGKRYVTPMPEKLAYTSADVVVSTPKKRAKKHVDPVDDLTDSLDDLDYL